MVDKEWVKKVQNLKDIFASVGVPLGIEEDKSNNSRLSAKLIFGDFPIEKKGNVLEMDMFLRIELSINKDKWETIIKKMEALTNEFAQSPTFLFDGWIKIEDKTDLIFESIVKMKGLISSC